MRLPLKPRPPSPVHLAEKRLARLQVGARPPLALREAWSQVSGPDEPHAKSNHGFLTLCFELGVDDFNALGGGLLFDARRHDGDAVFELHALAGEEDGRRFIGAIGSPFDGDGARQV